MNPTLTKYMWAIKIGSADKGSKMFVLYPGFYYLFIIKAKVYIESTIVSYLVAKPSRDLIVAAHQK